MGKKGRRRLKKKVKRNIIIIAIIAIIALGIGFTFMPINVRMNGSTTIELAYGETYYEPGARNLFGDAITDIEGEVDSYAMGTYTLYYRYLNTVKTRTIIVKDMNAPEMTLNGAAVMVVARGDEFNDPGCEASDDIDGDITNRIVTNGTVDTGTIGEYVIEYEVTDSYGNASIVQRKVVVIDETPLTLAAADFSLDGYFEGTILEETGEDTGEKLNDIIFVGDSVFDNLAVYGFVSKENAWTRTILDPENIYSTNLYMPRSTDTTGSFFSDGLSEQQPEYVCVYFGTDLVTSVSAKDYVRLFEKFAEDCQEASGQTQMIICSILPVSDDEQNEELNTKINQINYYVAAICQQYDMYFINCAEAFKDDNGYGNASYLTVDGIHPSEDVGCQILLDYISSHLSY